MKETEFINSRGEASRSQLSTDDYLLASGTGGALSEEPTGVFPSLTREQRNAILSVLKHFADALTIHRFTLDDRFGHKNVDNRDYDRSERITKMREDSLYVSNLFEDLIKELELHGSYNVLIREIEDKRRRQDDEVAVARDYAEARKRVAGLRKLVEEETNDDARDREELKAQLARAKNENKRLELKVGIESRYVTAREKARCEDVCLRCSVVLRSLREALGKLCSELKNERRVTAEIGAFLEQNVTTNERAASQWQERYEREMQIYENENGRLNDEIENRRQTLEKLRLEYRTRQEFIDRYVEEKEAMMERKEREKHREGCSIMIQAWWRGVMVRRKLGPYRPDEKKKKRAVKSKK